MNACFCAIRAVHSAHSVMQIYFEVFTVEISVLQVLVLNNGSPYKYAMFANNTFRCIDWLNSLD